MGVDLRLKRGEKIVGYKMGLTSKAKMEQVGLDTPIYGVLTDVMQIPNHTQFALKNSIHPKIEPEIALITKSEITAVPKSIGEALESLEWICSAMEILDSRYVGFKYFSLSDVVADNASSAYFILSDERKKPSEVGDPSNLSIEMYYNDRLAHRASSRAVLGNPITSFIELCSLLRDENRTLPAGSIILTGAATAAVELEAGAQVFTNIENLGRVEIEISH